MASLRIEELDAPQTGWGTVSRFAGVGCILLLLCIGAVPFFPKFAEYRTLNEEGREQAAKRDKLVNQLEEKNAQLQLIENDTQYLELKARDHLDLAKEGEVIFRFESKK